MTEHSRVSTGAVLSPASVAALTFIETALQQVSDEMERGESGEPVIQLRRLDSYDAVLSQDLVSTEFRARDHQVRYSWPACALAILDSIHAAISFGVAATKRDIFYSDPELFGDQNVVDRFVDDIAHSCKVPRAALFVTASPKGLFVMPQLDNDEPQNVPLAIPSTNAINWILVVEKEASFKTLCENRFHRISWVGPGMIVTAKGYPDLGTRQFLRSCVNSASTHLPIFGVFDYDPYGVDILKCYRSGSKVSAQEVDLNLSEMHWLGIRSEDIVDLPPSSSILPMTQPDRQRAVKLIESMTIGTSRIVEELKECRIELQRMLMLGRKAEIQILGDDVCRWAEQKMLAVISR